MVAWQHRDVIAMHDARVCEMATGKENVDPQIGEPEGEPQEKRRKLSLSRSKGKGRFQYLGKCEKDILRIKCAVPTKEHARVD